MQYNSVVPGARNWTNIIYPSWSGNVDKPVVAPIPDNKVRVLPAPTTRTWKDKPKSEVSWAEAKRLRLIKMTPYDTGKVHTEYHVMRLPDVSWKAADAAAHQPPKYWFHPVYLAKSEWIEQTSMMDHMSENPDIPHYRFGDVFDITKEINEVQSKVVSDSFSNFDLLTNLAEFPETLGMLVGFLKAARHPLTGIKGLIDKYKKARSRGKTHREAHDEIASQWMQYRYGIMPLVLSIQDAIELLDQKGTEFKTSRGSSSINFSPSDTNVPIITPRRYFYDKVSGSVKIRGVGKAKFSSEGLRLSDQITFNPFLTAWELIPMSFVIDWFVNVGDVIFSHTSTVMDLAEQRKFCLSVRRELYVETRYRSEYPRSYEAKWAAWPATSPGDGVPAGYCPAVDISEKKDFFVDVLARTHTESSYSRFLFNPTDVSFQYNPSISWRRSIDGYVLSLSTIRKVLKALQ